MAIFYMIEESVNRSYYITLDGIYDTEAQAQTALERQPSNQRMRVHPYQTGGWGTGPVRTTRGEN